MSAAEPHAFAEQLRDIEAEQLIIGCMLNTPSEVLQHVNGLDPRHFSEPLCQLAFAAATSIHRGGGLPTIKAVFDRLRGDDLGLGLSVEKIGEHLGRLAHAYSTNLADDAGRAAHRVADLATRRNLAIAYENAAIALRRQPGRPLEEIRAEIPVHASTAPGAPTMLSAKDFVAGYVAPEYLIDGLIQRSRVYSMTGQTGHGKTAVALAIGAHKALGRDLAGRRVDQGSVVYLAAENPDDICGRVVLLAERMGLDLGSLPLSFVPGAFNLTDGLGKIEDKVKEIGGASLIIVDTGAAFLAATGETEENNNLALLRFAYDLRKLTTLPGKPTSLALMHPTKYATRDNLLPRGGGAFLNEMDGNLTVWADGDRETTELSWAGKLRGPSFDPITFALETGACGKLVDAAGRMIPSVWAYPASTQRAEQAAERQRDDEDAALLVMYEAPIGSLTTWAKSLAWTLSNGEPAKHRVQRAINRLKDDKLAIKKRDRWTLTSAGKKEAERLKEQV